MDFLNIKRTYSGPADNIGKDLINPMLSDCSVYRRHTAWFRQSALTVWAPALKDVIDNKTKVEILVSLLGGPDEQIVNELEKLITPEAKKNYLIEHTETILDAALALSNSPRTVPLRSHILRYLIANDQLEIRFAISRPVKWEATLYHKKEGYFQDKYGKELYFNGSFNESESGMSSQGEQAWVWHSENLSHVEDLQNSIEALNNEWNNQNEHCEIVEVSKSTIDGIKEAVGNPKLFLENLKRSRSFVENTFDEPIEAESEPPNVPVIPLEMHGKSFKLQQHQQLAYGAWKNTGSGILSHATGSGKTITAIYTASKIALNNSYTSLIIQVPFQPLADQWVEELKQFNLFAIPCYRSRDLWEEKLDQAISLSQDQQKNYLLPIVVVDKTYNSEHFQDRLQRLEKNTLIYVSDECHRFAKIGKTSRLPEARFKLGLSGSPFNSLHHDSLGDIELQEYFGPPCHTYDISDALKDGVLTPYEYKLVACSLSIEEHEAVREQQKIIAQQLSSNVNNEPTLALQIAAGKMNRIIGSAEDKFIQLRKILSKNPKSDFQSSLFFCGDGSTEDEETFNDDDGDLIRDINRVGKLLGDSGITWRKFTASETTRERKDALQGYINKEFDALVAIRILDEGIDVPGIKTAFLMASTSNKRQYIQRRGRILRKQEGKSKAVIYDFMIKPPEFNQGIIQKEIRRIIEIGKDCQNLDEIKSFIRDLLLEFPEINLTEDDLLLIEGFLDN